MSKCENTRAISHLAAKYFRPKIQMSLSVRLRAAHSVKTDALHWMGAGCQTAVYVICKMT